MANPTPTTAARDRWDWLHNVPVPPANVVALGVALLADRRRPLPIPGHHRGLQLIGMACAGAGVALAARSVAATTVVHLDDPRRLITTGPYALSRNPMYVAWDLVHLGVALLTRSGWALASLVLAAAQVHREVRAEERVLGVRFGTEYAQYRSAVPRYLWQRRRPERA